jgi:predicted MFS family arabinose efflux permease
MGLGGRLGERLNERLAGRGGELATVCLLTLIQGCTWNLCIPFLPLYARQLGGDELFVGILNTIPALLFIVSSIPGGVAASRRGKSLVFRLAFAGGAAAGALHAMSRHPWVLAAPQLLFGLSHAVFWPSQAAYLTEVIPERDRPAILGVVMSLNTLGAVLGPSCGGLLAQYAGYRAVFAASGVLSAVAFGVCGRLPHRSNAGNARDALGGAIPDSLSVVRRLLGKPVLRFSMAMTFVTFAFYALVDTFFPLFLEDLGLGPASIGMLVTARTAAMTALRLGSGAFVNRTRASVAMPACIVASCAAMVVASLAGTATRPLVLAGCCAVMGAASGMVPVFSMLLIASATGVEERPVATGLDAAWSSVGTTVGSLSFGAVSKASGLATCMWAGSAAIGTAALGAAARLGGDLDGGPAGMEGGVRREG